MTCQPVRNVAVLFATLLVLALLASPTRADEVSYQGELRVQNQPFTGNADMKFVIFDRGTGLTLWSNDGSGLGAPPQQPVSWVDVPIAQGLFAVDLGGTGMTRIPDDAFAGVVNADLRLWVRTTGQFEQFTDQPLHSSVFTHQAYCVRQIDPGATGFMAKWDGLKLGRSSIADVGGNTVFSTGNIGLGVTNPETRLQLDGKLSFVRSPGDEGNAGKIDYRGFLPTALSIVGAGTTNTNRRVHIFDTLTVGDASGTQFVVTQGNLGIGTGSPLHALSVVRAQADLRIGLHNTGSGGREYNLISTSSGSGVAAGSFRIHDRTTGNDRLVIGPAGNVGIGTASPQHALSISRSQDDLRIGLDNTGSGGREYNLISTSSGSGVAAGSFRIFDRTVGSDRLVIGPTGNIGIGTASPSQRLDVAGEIRTSVGVRYPDGTLQTSAGVGGGGYPGPLGVVDFQQSGVFIVPQGVSRLEVMIWGAGGGGNNEYSGGSGAFARCVLAVTPGEQLSVTIGAGGEYSPVRGGDGGDSSIRRQGVGLVLAGGGQGAQPSGSGVGGQPVSPSGGIVRAGNVSPKGWEALAPFSGQLDNDDVGLPAVAFGGYFDGGPGYVTLSW